MRLVDFFDRGASNYPNRDVIRFCGESWTYAAMRRLTMSIANAIASAGLRADDVVASLTPNHPMGFAAHFGTMRAGPVWVALNARNSPLENTGIMEKLGVKMLFFHSDFEPELRCFLAGAPSLEWLVCLDGPSVNAPSMEQFTNDLAKHCDFPEKRPNDVVTLVMTGGTTGLPKIVMLTNRAWETMVASLLIQMPYDAPPVDVIVAPMSHAAGAHAMSLLSRGGTCVLLPKPDPLLIIQSIADHGASTLFLPPTLLYAILSHPQLGAFDYSSLRYLLYGGSPISVQRLREASAIFGPVMAQAYGQTEVLMAISFLSPKLDFPHFRRD